MNEEETTVSGSVDSDLVQQLLATYDKRVEEASSGTTAKAPVRRVKNMAKAKTAFPPGTYKFSKLFGPSKSGWDGDIRVHSENDWPEEVRYLIPQIDPAYQFRVKETEKMVRFLIDNRFRSGFSHGPKGSGKSTGIEQIHAVLRIPFFRVNLHGNSTHEDVMGGTTTDLTADGKVVLKRFAGPLETMAKIGGTVCIDEFSFLPSTCASVMQWVLEQNGKLYIAHESNPANQILTPHPQFRIWATDNTQLQGDTTGHYTGTHVQNEALVDRFHITIRIGYMAKSDERKILEAKLDGIQVPWLDKMQQFAELVRSSYNKGDIQFTLSPRGLLAWGQQAMDWDSLREGLDDTFSNKLTDADRAVIEKIALTVGI